MVMHEKIDVITNAIIITSFLISRAACVFHMCALLQEK